MGNAEVQTVPVTNTTLEPKRKRKRNFIYDFETSNKSFIQIFIDLKQLGVKNCAFFLKLYDSTLVGVDPFSPYLKEEQIMRIISECVRNPWYFLREVSRIPTTGITNGVPYLLNRANLAQAWCFINGIDSYETIPRQLGKTDSTIAILNWCEQFANTNSEFAFFNYRGDRAAANLDKLRRQREILPEYLKIKKFTDDGKVEKGKDNTYTITNPVTKNTLTAFASATSQEAADTRARGSTQPVQYYDELEFIKYIMTIMNAAGPAFKTAADNAKKNKVMYGRLFTSTPGDLDSDAGMDAAKVLSQTCRFSERFYSMNPEEVKEHIALNSENGIVYIEYSYKQLGKDEKWFADMCRFLNNDVTKIKREILLQRIHGSTDSPYDPEALSIINDKRGVIIDELFISSLYKFDLYEKLDPSKIYFVGVDTSTSVGADNNTITIFDPYTIKPVGEFKSPYINPIQFKQLILILVRKYIPRAIVIIEKSPSASGLIASLMASPIKNRLYSDPRRDIDDDTVDITDEFGFVKKEARRRKTYGLITSSKTRPRMFDLLDTHVREYKDRFVCNNIIDDLMKLVRKNTKIQAASGFHDDSIMSYLFCLYVYYYGTNLIRYGFEKGMSVADRERQIATEKANDVYEYMSDTDKEFFKDYEDEYNINKELMQDMESMLEEEDLETLEDEDAIREYVNAKKSEMNNVDPYEYKLFKEKQKLMKTAGVITSDGGIASVSSLSYESDYEEESIDWFDELIY